MRTKLLILLTSLTTVTIVSCGVPKKVLHCDHCGKAIEVDQDSVMEEDWILYCKKCHTELGLDDLVK